MNTKLPPTSNNRLANFVVGIVVILLIAGGLVGFHLWLGLGDHVAFILLTIAGMALCLAGMKIEVYGWKNPFNLLGSGLGTIILLLVIAVCFGIPLPLIASNRGAFITLSVLITVKVVLAFLRGFNGKPVRPTQNAALE